jgi:hypothetical protein
MHVDSLSSFFSQTQYFNKDVTMKKMRNFLPLIITVVAVFAFSMMLQSPVVEAAKMAQEAPSNHIFVDVTYNPNTMNYSVGGLTKDQLIQLGVPEIPADVWNMVANLNKLNLTIDQTGVNVVTDDVKLATIDWTKESRTWLYSMVNAYTNGVPMDEARAEEWLDKANIDVQVRRADTLSEPLVISLDTPVRVDISDAGEIKVEGFVTGQSLTPEMNSMLKTGNIKHAAVCWSEGAVATNVNGTTLPQITLFQDGLSVVDKAFGLQLPDLSLLFQSQVGADVVVGEGMHSDMQCGGN